MRIALEIKNGIDDMLKNARPGQGTILGDVSDKYYGDPGVLGQPRELRRALAHLGHRTGCRIELLGPQGLDRIDDRHLRLFPLQQGDYFSRLISVRSLSFRVSSAKRRARMAIC